MSTAIVTKYSTANTVPTANSLLGGELAYSFPSGNLFIGTEAGSYEIIGGSYYTNIIDQRSSNTSSGTLVLRNVDGDIRTSVFISTQDDTPGFIGNLDGIADRANALHNSVQIVLSGDVQSNVFTTFGNTVNFQVELSTIVPGVSGTYGNSTNIPVITVDTKGRVTAVSNLAISVASQEQATAAFDKANAANVLAQAAFNAANSLSPNFNQSAFDRANAAFNLANSSSLAANTPSSIANIALDLAVLSYIHANAAFAVSNEAFTEVET